MYASHNGHLDVVKRLLEFDVDVNARASDGKTPLIWATDEGHVEVVR